MKRGVHGRTRSSGTPQGQILLGQEPPLFVAGTTETLTGRRAVSVRWLLGTVLTGVTSVALMGGALTVALDGSVSVAAPTGYATTATALLDNASSRLPKSDRVQAPPEAPANKQIIQVSTVTKQGDSDLIRVKPYVHLSTPLATTTDPDAGDIPAFDPLQAFADTKLFPDRAGTDSIYGAAVEGEVTVSSHDFPLGSPLIDPDLTLSSDEVEQVVREDSLFKGADPKSFAGGEATPQQGGFDPRFAFAFAAVGAASSSFTTGLQGPDVKIVTENVSEVAKTGKTDDAAASDAGAAAPARTSSDLIVTVAKGDTLVKILTAAKARATDAKAIARIFSKENGIDGLSAGEKVRIGLLPDTDDPDVMKPARVSLYDATSHLGTVALDDDDRYVVAEEPQDDFIEDSSVEEAAPVETDGSTPTLYESLFQTARREGMPEALVGEIVHMFSFDVDFNSRVRAGDKLEMFYADDADVGDGAPPDVLFAALTVAGQQKRLYRFRAPDDGSVDYYDFSGRSAQKFLMRKPMNGGIFRSGFGGRRHPILGYVRMHPGVDWAAPRGTPIVASGNGVVKEAGWKSGYGKWVLLGHGNGYDTGYGHMSRIADNLRPGQKVRQGQVIGYVGSTGLSTGSHLHYEVHINGTPVDPLRIRLPQGRELKGTVMAAFSKERQRVDDLVGSSGGKPADVAQAN